MTFSRVYSQFLFTEVDEYLKCPQVSDESQMMPYASHPASSSMTDQTSTDKKLEKWEDKHVRLLIECYLKVLKV